MGTGNVKRIGRYLPLSLRAECEGGVCCRIGLRDADVCYDGGYGESGIESLSIGGGSCGNELVLLGTERVPGSLSGLGVGGCGNAYRMERCVLRWAGGEEREYVGHGLRGVYAGIVEGIEYPLG